MNKEKMRKIVQRQQEIMDGANEAGRELTTGEQAEFDALQRDFDALKEVTDDLQAERQRLAEITELARDFGFDPHQYIDDGTPAAEVREMLVDKAKSRGLMPPPTITITAEADDKFRDAAVDALLFRGGLTLENPAPGYKDLIGARLTSLASEALAQKGVYNAHRMDDDTLLREAMTPNSQFTGILDATVNKSMAIAYKAASTTYQRWTSRSSNPNFKPTKVYQIGEAGELLPITQSGEFKFDELQDTGVSKTLATYGRGWSLNRQAIIDDNLDMLTKVPAAYARSAHRGINKLVYKLIGENGAFVDGVNLFDAAHANLAAVGGAITHARVGAARATFRKQKNLRGLEYLNVEPKFLIVPTDLEIEAWQLINSKANPEASSTGVANTFYQALELVSDPELDPYSSTAWYMAAAPGEIGTVEVTYLNEKDLPTIESQPAFDSLGMKWRIFIDYGVTLLDFRGLYKNAGI